MRLSASQVVVIKQEHGKFRGAAQVPLFGSQAGDNQSGFTLIELIMVMIIAGILASVVVPRFLDANVFKSRGFFDQVQATLRYAQKEAIAQHRNVCVTFTLPAPSTITLRIASLNGAAGICNTNLTSPAGGAYVVTAPAGIAFAALPTAFTYDALGRPNPSALPAINVAGATNSIVIEAETGYVHSP